MYYKVTLKSLNPVSHETRKKYLESMYGSHSNGKRGSIDKFCRAIGFKPIMDDWYRGSVIIDAEIPSPESYQKPAQMLFQGLHVELGENNIVSFVVPLRNVKHPNQQFSYHTAVLCQKLAKFLRKVYGDIIIEQSIVAEISEMSDDEFVLDFIYQSLDFQDSLYTVECSTSRMLTENELTKIYQKLNGATAYNWHIEQFYCETCASYHPHAPFHTEVIYDM